MAMDEYSFINPYTVIMSSVMGMVILQITSIIIEKVFNKPPLYIGPFMLLVLVAGAVYAASGILASIMRGETYQNPKGFMARQIVLLVVTMTIIALLYFLLPQWVPTIFQSSVAQSRAMLGLG
jgi:hypothetical protein